MFLVRLVGKCFLKNDSCRSQALMRSLNRQIIDFDEFHKVKWWTFYIELIRNELQWKMIYCQIVDDLFQRNAKKQKKNRCTMANIIDSWNFVVDNQMELINCELWKSNGTLFIGTCTYSELTLHSNKYEFVQKFEIACLNQYFKWKVIWQKEFSMIDISKMRSHATLIS